jgi:hypothetical protein
MEKLQFHISEYYAPALVNDERSYLSDEEAKLLDAFLEENPNYYCVIMDEEFDEPIQMYGKCEVSNLYAWIYVLENC